MSIHRLLLLAGAAGLILGAPAVVLAQDASGELAVSFPPFASGVQVRMVIGPAIALAPQGGSLVLQRPGWSTPRTLGTGALIGGGIGAATGCALGLASGEDGAALYTAGLLGATGAANGAAAALVSRHVYRRARRATPTGGVRWKAVLAGAGTGAALGVLTGVLAADRDHAVVGALSGILGGTTGTVVAAVVAHR
jgi:hypothetical protein